MPGDLEFLARDRAEPYLVVSSLSVKVALVRPQHLLYFASLHILTPSDSILARVDTCVNEFSCVYAFSDNFTQFKTILVTPTKWFYCLEFEIIKHKNRPRCGNTESGWRNKPQRGNVSKNQRHYITQGSGLPYLF